MIYLDPPVVLAWLLTEVRRLPTSFWDGTLVSSWLIEYEIRTPLYVRGLADSHGKAVRRLIGRIALLELTPQVLARALEAFPGPGPPRILVALHLASCAYLAARDYDVKLANYDRRMNDVAHAMDISLFDPEGASIV